MLRRLARALARWVVAGAARPPAAVELRLAGAPDDVLLRSVPVLRGLRARITRYDIEAGTLEARLPRRRAAEVVRLRVAADAVAGGTRLRVEGGGRARRALVRRLRGLAERSAGA
jgi:hypothetical protein